MAEAGTAEAVAVSVEEASTVEVEADFTVEVGRFTVVAVADFTQVGEPFGAEADSAEGSPRLPQLVTAHREPPRLLPCARGMGLHLGLAIVLLGLVAIRPSETSDLEAPSRRPPPPPTADGIPLATPAGLELQQPILNQG